MSSQPHTRIVTAADVPAVIDLIRGVLAEFGLTFGEGSETDAHVSRLPDSYEAHGGRFWVALLGEGALVGTCGVYPVAAATYELRKMYLLPTARGLGLGRRLLDIAIGFACERRATQLVLDTTEQMTQACAFYEANGFVRDDGQIRGPRCSRGYRLDLPPAGRRHAPGMTFSNSD
jgi:putative acetyltransferase